MIKIEKAMFQKVMTFFLLLCFFTFFNLTLSQEGLSELRGKVFQSDGKTPIVGATVKAYHISSGKIYNSKPTDPSGSYSLTHLPYGYYDLAVETEEGLFVSTQAINVAPNTKLNISFALSSFKEQPEEWWTGKEKPSFPALKQESSGIAKIIKRKGARAFWKSGKGVATIIIGSAAVIGIAAAGGGGGGEASPK